MIGLLTRTERSIFVLGAVPFSLSLMAECGGGNASTGSTSGAVTAAVTPTVTVAASPSGSVSNAQAISVSIAVGSSSGAPSGSVVVSSGNYASLPATVSAGQALVSVPAALLAVGTDTLSADFTPSDPSSYNRASGTTNVTVVASGAPVPAVTASSVTYSTGGYGSPFRALPLASGNVLVSVTAATSGTVVFGPTAGGGLQLSCFNYLRPAFVQDGAADFGMNLLPNGLGLAETIGVDGAVFYNLSTMQTCNSTGLQVSQGSVSADEGSFDVVVTPDGKYAFVANEYGIVSGSTAQGNIGVVALQYDASGVVTTGTTLVGQISTGGQTIAGVAISPDGGRLYAASEVEGTVTTAAGGSNPILTRTGCYQQAGGGKLLAVANSNRFGTGTANATVLSIAVPAAASVVRTIPTGLFPREITAGGDDQTLYLTNYDSGTFQVISTTVQ